MHFIANSYNSSILANLYRLCIITMRGKKMYNIKKVSDIVGIPVLTIRAWENRYRIITPNRSEGGHRLFSEEDINKLKFLKRQIDEHGLKISEAVRMLQRTEFQAAAEKTTIALTSHSYEPIMNELYEHLIKYNTFQANASIDLAFSLYPYEIVFRHILIPVLHRIGSEWEEGLVTVAQEHFASQIIMHRFSQLFRILPIDPSLPKALAFCPEGEHHHLGLMHFSLFLKKKGIDVIYLGPNTPLSGIKNVIEMKSISIVAISATDSISVDKLIRWIKSCCQPHLKFVLGGAALESLAEQLDIPNVFCPALNQWEQCYSSLFEMNANIHSDTSNFSRRS